MSENNSYFIRVTDEDLRSNNKLQELVTEIVDQKLRSEKADRHFIYMSKSEYGLLKKYRQSQITPWEKYAKSPKELYTGEVGKFAGKKIIVKNG